MVGPALILGPKLEVSCIIRDLSSTGAKIEVPTVVNLLLKTNSSRYVLLRWKKGAFGRRVCLGDWATERNNEQQIQWHQEQHRGHRNPQRGRSDFATSLLKAQGICPGQDPVGLSRYRSLRKRSKDSASRPGRYRSDARALRTPFVEDGRAALCSGLLGAAIRHGPRL